MSASQRPLSYTLVSKYALSIQLIAPPSRCSLVMFGGQSICEAGLFGERIRGFRSVSQALAERADFGTGGRGETKSQQETRAVLKLMHDVDVRGRRDSRSGVAAQVVGQLAAADSRTAAGRSMGAVALRALVERHAHSPLQAGPVRRPHRLLQVEQEESSWPR